MKEEVQLNDEVIMRMMGLLLLLVMMAIVSILLLLTCLLHIIRSFYGSFLGTHVQVAHFGCEFHGFASGYG